MFKSSFFTLAFALFATLLSANPAPTPGTLADIMTTLRAGTIVSLEVREELTSENVEVGNIVELMVRSNVTVNGRVIIAAGALAEGEVTSVTKDCRGCQEMIQITVRNAQAVDGQRLWLRSAPLKKTARRTSTSAVINIGTSINSTVLNDVDINA